MSEKTASPVVLLHGVGLDKSVWEPLRSRLERESVTLDLPGHGEQPPLDAPTSLAEMAEDVASRMPGQPVHLVGFSLGGMVAARIAAAFPEKILSLSLVSCVGRRTDSEREAVRARFEKASQDLPSSMRAAVDRWFPVEGAEITADESIETLRARTARVLDANDPVSYVHAYRVFVDGDQAIEADLPAIRVPSLVVTGALDHGSTVAMAEYLASRIPEARVAVVPGARHMLPVTHPRELARELEKTVLVPVDGAVADERTQQ